MLLSPEQIKQLRQIYPVDGVCSLAADCWPYGYDNSKLHHCPDAVVFPLSHQQVIDTVAFCNQENIFLTTRGRGTGTTGAAVPIQAGIVMSFERMDQLLDIDSTNRTATVQPGITNQQLQNRLGEQGFFWPPDPSSAAYCTVGGNIACNASGPRAVKYGSTRENVLGLTAVTGNGKTLRTGALTTKSATGYDLTRLLIGSEGTLAIVTEAILKITPLPPAKATLRALYSSNNSACSAVGKVMGTTPVPCALEFMDSNAVRLIRQQDNVKIDSAAQAILMVEVDGSNESIGEDTEQVKKNLHNDGCLEIRTAQDKQEVTDLWSARKALSPALRSLAPNKINEDVVVPVSRLTNLIIELDRISQNYQLKIVNFGHAGNGNLHVNIMYNAGDEVEKKNAALCLDQIFQIVIDLGGTLSGEHGIGCVKRDHIAQQLDAESLRLIRAIKKQFDPNLILNPGKLIPM